jgi:predicted alpha/beta-fold hydrolase
LLTVGLNVKFITLIGAWRWLALSSVASASLVAAAASGPDTGLADSAALRATVYGTPAADIAPLPATVPLQEIDIALPWRRPVPEIFWFDRRLRAWFAAQDHPATLVVLVSGTGSDGNTPNIATLRAALYGAGYHVLSLPSPTFPGFIVAASSTGVAGDLLQDSRDLYAAMQQIIAHLPHRELISDIDLVGYSLGGTNAAMVKSLAAADQRLSIHRLVMIDPPISLFSSIGRLDQLFVQSIGPDDAAVERLYRRLYTRIANVYRTSDQIAPGEGDVLAAATNVLHSDADLSAAIALNFRIALMNVFLAGDLYSGAGVVTDPRHPPHLGDSLEELARQLRSKPFAEYFDRVLAPYYLAHRAGATRASLLADNRLEIIGQTLRTDHDYYAQANSDDPVLIQSELDWLRATLGDRIAVYDYGGHLGNLGDRRQVADMLEMLAGHWHGAP